MSRIRLARSLFACFLVTSMAFAQGDTPAAELRKVRGQAEAAVRNGDFETAAAGYRKLTEANPKDAQAWHMLGYSLHAGGKLDEAMPVHMKATEFKSTASPATYNVACVHAMQGRSDEAFAWLGKAIALGFADADLLANDTDLDSLREDARFAELQQTLRSKAPAAGPKAFVQKTQRENSRVIWFGKNGSPGQISIDYAPVAWKDEFDGAFADGRLVGKRWRFGSDFWTSLDTSVPLQIAGVAVPPGYYYLTLLQRDADSLVLGVHDAAEVRKQKLDAVFAQQLKGGIEVPLQHETDAETADTLSIALAVDRTASNTGELTIRFGGHRLTAPVQMQLD